MARLHRMAFLNNAIHLFVRKSSKNLPPRTNKQMAAGPPRSGHSAILSYENPLKTYLRDRKKERERLLTEPSQGNSFSQKPLKTIPRRMSERKIEAQPGNS